MQRTHKEGDRFMYYLVKHFFYVNYSYDPALFSESKAYSIISVI